MDNNKKYELKDEMLDNVAGGRDGWAGFIQYGVRNEDYACSNCGGHEFLIVDSDGHYYNGSCLKCGTHNLRVGIPGYSNTFPMN